MNIQFLSLVPASEDNAFCILPDALESDGLVFFHLTPEKNQESIESCGFKSGKALGINEIESVSYARNSSGCLDNKPDHGNSTYVIYAVRFTNEQLEKVHKEHNEIEIKVYRHDIQPEILGKAILPKGYKRS